MIKSKIKKEERQQFYQSKFEYFKKVSGYSAMLIGILEMMYFYSDCQLFGRFAYETIIPRFSIIIPMIVFWTLYPRIKTYVGGVLLYYIMPHAAMWCTIWAIWYLPNRDFAREGFIIMHFAFLAIGLAMPLKYHAIIHALLLFNIIISNTFNHYETFPLMISLALPLYIGVIIMLYIFDTSYADQYLIRQKLVLSSISDELTGTFNRYKIDQLIDKKTEAFVFNQDVVLLMFDIDYFKKVNDTYGHDAGDRILQFVTSEIRSQIYGRDFIIRWGGEEFIVILVDYTIEQAKALAEKLRVDVESSNNGICPVTISIGLCKYTPKENYHDTISKADQALYYAKEHGRNMVVNYDEL